MFKNEGKTLIDEAIFHELDKFEKNFTLQKENKIGILKKLDRKNNNNEGNTLIDIAIFRELNKFEKGFTPQNESKIGSSKEKMNRPKTLILPEIFYEILHFLDRKSLEKCQFVSRSWNKFIASQSHLLEQQIIEELDLLSFELFDRLEDDDRMAKVNWKIAVINRLNLYAFNVNNEYDALEEIRERTGDFIRVRQLEIYLVNQRFDLDSNIENMFLWLSRASNYLVRPLKTQLILCQDGVKKLAENPRLMNFYGMLSIQIVGRTDKFYTAPNLAELFANEEFECTNREIFDFGNVNNRDFVEEYVKCFGVPIQCTAERWNIILHNRKRWNIVLHNRIFKLFQKLPTTDLWKLFRRLDATPTEISIHAAIHFMEQSHEKKFIHRIQGKSITSRLFSMHSSMVEKPKNFIEKNYRVNRKYDKCYMLVMLKNSKADECKVNFEIFYENE